MKENSFEKNEKFSYVPHSISLRLASPEKIRQWSFGEVTKPETINYRTGRSERHGLFDERIFGPDKDYECYCKKYRGIKYKGIVCEKCGVELTKSVVRRERMGHIELATPVAHIWMLRGIPSRMSLLLDIPVYMLEKVIYFSGYIVTKVYEKEKEQALRDLESEYKAKFKTLTNDESREKLRDVYATTKREIVELVPLKVLTEIDYHRYAKKYSTLFEAGIGAETVYQIFKSLDLAAMEKMLVEDLSKDPTNHEKVERRLSLIRSLLRSGTKPEWMFMSVIPVIPAGIRPMVGLEGGRFATSDANDLYRRVLNRNNRLKKLIEINAPDVILRNEKRILQEAVDALIDNSIKKHSGSQAMSQSQRRSLKSLSDNLKGKQGILRQNLLGKRVDYSGRSVIVVGPNLKLNQCGLPKYMALELFRPFVIAKIMERELAFNIRGAGRLIEDGVPEVWEILEEVISSKYVLLNRAPTLHRLSIQAFKPVLIEGKAIQVHPLVCTAFNADFDGDQMAVHVPLSEKAQAEADQLVASNRNLLKPQSAEPIVTPNQDIVLGVYWMTKEVQGAKGEGSVFSSPNEAILAYDYGHVDFRSKIKVLPTDTQRYAVFEGKLFETTVGRILFNSILPRDFSFINKEIKKKDLSRLVSELIDLYGIDGVPDVLDKIKAFGYRYVTVSGTTWSHGDVIIPNGKKEIVDKARKQEEEIRTQFEEGLISDEERHRKIIDLWEGAKAEIQGLVQQTLSQSTSLNDMVTSQARGSIVQATMMAGMKGIIVNTQGKPIDYPIIPSLKEGLSPIEYFISTHGSRKGLADTALNTAKAGYLTRRLVDVSQSVVVVEEDCGTEKHLVVKAENIDGMIKSLAGQVFGRVLAKDVVVDGQVLFPKGHMVNKHDAEKIDKAGVKEVAVYSPLTCESKFGLCAKCYGYDLGRTGKVKVGEAVGIVAAQAIGEPGTQLTLRTFHAGGAAGLDITAGLPRVEEIFERRTIAKNPAIVAQKSGEVMGIRVEPKKKIIEVLSDPDGKNGSKMIEYVASPRRVVTVKKGDRVIAGQILTDGSANISEVFKFGGEEMAQRYIIQEINKVYELHGSPVSPKHIEIIIKQMFSRRKVVKPGDSEFTTGEVVETDEIERINQELLSQGKEPIESRKMVLGISEVSLSAKSWLSAASFQHTTRTLIANSIKGGHDSLRGLKENVIIGNLIPAGTGLNPDFINVPHDDNSFEAN